MQSSPLKKPDEVIFLLIPCHLYHHIILKMLTYPLCLPALAIKFLLCHANRKEPNTWAHAKYDMFFIVSIFNVVSRFLQILFGDHFTRFKDLIRLSFILTIFYIIFYVYCIFANSKIIDIL